MSSGILTYPMEIPVNLSMADSENEEEESPVGITSPVSSDADVVLYASSAGDETANEIPVHTLFDYLITHH